MPTIKQKRAYKELMENKGLSMTKAMIKAGYPKTTAKNPQQVTKSIGWQKLMERYLPDKKLTQVHNQGLNAKKLHSSPTEPDRWIKDYATRHKYLETAYKLKGRLKEVNIEADKVLVIPSELMKKNNIDSKD